MKRAAVFLVVVLVLGIWWAQRSKVRPPAQRTTDAVSDTAPVATGVAVTAVSTPVAAGTGQSVPLLGDTILRDYANTNLSPEHDLTLMSRLMENSLLLLKSAASRPLSANEDWAGLLRGQTAARERFLPDQHVALNAQGQLVDRWGTPLFIHALGGARFELRSAGPDKKLWTADDVHRNADGSFRRGRDLDAPSLLETSTRRR